MIKEISLSYSGDTWEKDKKRITDQVKAEGFDSGHKLSGKYDPRKLIKLAKAGDIEAYHIMFGGTGKWYYKMDDVLKKGHQAIKS